MGDFDEDVTYDKGNKYERQSVLALDMDILGTSDFSVLNLTAGDRLHLHDDQRARMRAIISDGESAHSEWGFKDPRCTLTYPLWAEELPPHKIIAVFRNPAQVWPRFRWNGKRLYFTNFHRAHSYLKRWHEHNLGIADYLEKGTNDFLVINYHELMTGDSEFQRLEAFVGRDLVDRRRLDLYRSRTSGDLFLKVAGWYLEKNTGLTCEGTLSRLEALR